MTDRELLELAAKAAGITLKFPYDPSTYQPVDCVPPRRTDTWENWNPLTDDGDALRLAVALGLSLRTTRGFEPDESRAISNKHELGASYLHGMDSYAATRRAIVRAAAEIGRKS